MLRIRHCVSEDAPYEQTTTSDVGNVRSKIARYVYDVKFSRNKIDYIRERNRKPTACSYREYSVMNVYVCPCMYTLGHVHAMRFIILLSKSFTISECLSLFYQILNITYKTYKTDRVWMKLYCSEIIHTRFEWKSKLSLVVDYYSFFFFF